VAPVAPDLDPVNLLAGLHRRTDGGGKVALFKGDRAHRGDLDE